MSKIHTINFTKKYIWHPGIHFILWNDRLLHVDISLDGVTTQGELARYTVIVRMERMQPTVRWICLRV